MKAKLEPVSEQIIVITGASSGIGLVTARLAAERGARLVLAARSGEALRELCNELNRPANRTVAVPVVADVSWEEDVNRIVQAAETAFGGFDTWVNNAGVSIYGRIEDVPVSDARKLFDTNFFGLVYGSLAAVNHLKTRPGGGALIQLGSELSDRAIPLQGFYSASKHAVKGFTDTLRMELEKEGVPISVTLVKPGPIDTPHPHHTKNYLVSEPQHTPPVYAPLPVARAILTCAEKPVRNIIIGGGAKQQVALGQNAPALTDVVMEKVFSGSESGQPSVPPEDNGLARPVGRLEERGGFPGHVKETSLYTEAALRPGLTWAVGVAALVGVGLAVAAWMGGDGDHRASGWRR